MMNPLTKSARRGAIGVATVIAMVIMQLMIITVVMGGARDQELFMKRIDSMHAFYATEGGLNMAIREMRIYLDEDGDGTIGRISDDGNAANDPVIGGGNVRVTSTMFGAQTTLVSDGRSSQNNSLRQAETIMDGAGGAGLAAGYYVHGGVPTQLSDIDWNTVPDATTVVSKVDFAVSGGEGWPTGPINNWGKRFTGKIDIPVGGNWTFYTTSDDGSRVWINSGLVVDNDGIHAFLPASGTIALAAGEHDIEIQWFESAGVFGLVLEWECGGCAPVETRKVVPASRLSH